jgi:hypothetical protein
VWPEPQPDEELALAEIVARYAQFLHPEIVQAIVEDNEKHRATWSEALKQRGIDPSAYLWPRSACTFPGVRRYAGSTEIAIFRKKAKGPIKNALALDDNEYPKQVWAYTLTGKKFAKHGPKGYALAHLADHKTYKNKAESDFHAVDGEDRTELHGLYTSARSRQPLALPVHVVAHAAIGPVAVEHARQHEQQVRQAVQVLARRIAHRLGAASATTARSARRATVRHTWACAAARVPAGRMNSCSRGSAALCVRQRRVQLRHRLVLEQLEAGDGQLAAQVEQLVLDVDQQLAHCHRAASSHSSRPMWLFSSSTSPMACARPLALETRVLSPRPVVPSSPVRVAICVRRLPMAQLTF